MSHPFAVTIGIEQFQLEGTYNDHLVELPDHSMTDQKLKHTMRGIVQMPLFRALIGMGH